MADSTTTPEPSSSEDTTAETTTPARRTRRRAGAPAGAPAASGSGTSPATGTDGAAAAAPRTVVPTQSAAPAAETPAAPRTRRRAGAPAGAPVFQAPTAALPVDPPTTVGAVAPEDDGTEDTGLDARTDVDTSERTERASTARSSSRRAAGSAAGSPATGEHGASVADELRALATARGAEEAEDPEAADRRERAQLDFASLLFQAPAPAQPRTTVGPQPENADDADDADDAEDADDSGTEPEGSAEPDDTDDTDETPDTADTAERSSRRGGRSRGRSRRRGGSRSEDERDAASGSEDRDGSSDDGDSTGDSDQESDEDSGSSRRRRRRGGRGRRGRGRGDDERGEDGEDSDGTGRESSTEDPGSRGDTTTDEDSDGSGRDGSSDEDGSDEEGSAGGSSSRRRRRRRRSGTTESGDASPDDPPNTVVKVREARDEVKSVKGSTRLEAKKQRRREGRDAGRKRNVITEAEFLARRESVKRSMVVRERPGRTQIAVLEDDVLVEHYVAQKSHTSMVGNVYLGKVQNVLPSMEAAFVDIGKGRNAVLYAGEVNWDAVGMEGQPRRIELALKSGDPVLVQVTKDPIGHKGARLTSQISLPGRYLVFVPGGSMTGISRKLPDTERSRLKKLLRSLIPEDAGVIVRTAAEGASEEELTHDVERLRAQWERIQKAQKAKSAPVALSQEPDLAIKVVRDVFNEDFTSLIVQGSEAHDAVHSYVSDVAPDLLERVTAHVGTKDVFAKHRIDEQLLKAMDRKVYLPSGGSLVIDRTEAMTVVDVNTGKFTGTGGSLEETVTRNNLEAAEEIVRQLRLRDIGGIIVVDFIDMVLEANRDLVLRRLVECLGRDRTKHQVAEVTSLGLVQMTRKRVGQGLVETFSTTCEHCSGRGLVVDLDGEAHQHGGSGNGGDDNDSSSGGSSSRSGKRRRGKGRGGSGAESSESTEGSGSSGGTGSSGSASADSGLDDAGDVHRLHDDDSRALARATIASIAAASGSHAQPEVVVDGQVVTTGTADTAPAEVADDGADAPVLGDVSAPEQSDAPDESAPSGA